MPNHLHYIPILKWKRAERIALRNLDISQKRRLIPLIQPVPSQFTKSGTLNPETVMSTVKNIISDISKDWGTSPLFFDDILLAPINRVVGESLVTSFAAQLARDSGLTLIPVTNFNRHPLHIDSVSVINSLDNNGICLRIPINDTQSTSLSANVSQLREALNIDHGDVDLIIDHCYLENIPREPLIISRLQSPHRWRSITLAGGSFPKDLSNYSIGQHEIPRLEWINWRDNYSRNDDIVRIPTYSDYLTQYPFYTPPIDGVNPSASIRYTSDDYWTIMRGRGLRGPNKEWRNEQYPANAQLLSERPEFIACGPTFSNGDKYIYDKRFDMEHRGSPETWLRAGFNHHLAFVTTQISNLYGIPLTAEIELGMQI